MSRALPTQVIFDTDLGFGLPGHRPDAGLALLYLLGRDDAVLAGVTTVAGEVPVDAVTDAAAWTLRIGGGSGIPVVEGSSGPGEYESPAAAFLAEQAARRPGELTVVTTGSPANLHGASLADPEFYSNLGGLVLTGGLEHPYQAPFWGRDNDLQLSRDPAAASRVLAESRLPRIVTMHTGGLLTLSLDDIIPCRDYSKGLYHILKEYLLSPGCRELCGRDEMQLWALAAAFRVTHPEDFREETLPVVLDGGPGRLGRLKESPAGRPAVLCRGIDAVDVFFREAHQAWAASLEKGFRRILSGGKAER